MALFDPAAVKSPSDLPKDGPVVIETDGDLHLAMRRPFGYDFHWLREATLGAVEGDLGLKIAAAGQAALTLTVAGARRQEISLDERGWLRLRVFKSRAPGLGIPARLSVSVRVEIPPPGKLDALLETVPGLRDSIYQKTAAALEKKYSAEASYCYASAAENAALVDCSFDFTEEGLNPYRQALDGDYAWMPLADAQHVEIHRGALTCEPEGETCIELHLPFFDRKEWASRFELLAGMEVSSDEDGRLLVCHVDASRRAASQNLYQSVLALAGGLSMGRFTLSYSDQRRLPCALAPVLLEPLLHACGFDESAARWLDQAAAGRDGDLEVSFTLSIPGSLASAWLRAPGELDPFFFTAYSRVSVAVQRSMRGWLPYVYFADPRRYETPETAFPLVVYQASPPFAGQPKYDFNYDVMSDASMASFYRLAAQQLPKELARIEAMLLAAGKPRIAALYRSKRARDILSFVRQKPKSLHSLLVADAIFVNALVNLGCRGRELREQSAGDPAAAKKLSRFAADLAKALNGKLRRLYGGQECFALGSLLLVEATNALHGDASGQGVQAVLRVSRGEKGQPGSIEHTFVNAAYRPSAG